MANKLREGRGGRCESCILTLGLSESVLRGTVLEPTIVFAVQHR